MISLIEKQKQYLTVDEVAERMTTSRATIWRWVSPDKKPEDFDFPRPIKLGGATRWRLADILEFEARLQPQT